MICSWQATPLLEHEVVLVNCCRQSEAAHIPKPETETKALLITTACVCNSVLELESQCVFDMKVCSDYCIFSVCP